MDTPVVIEEPADLGASLAVGYNSHYIFRGVSYGQNQITTQLDYEITALPIPVAIGAWYGNPIDSDSAGHVDQHAGHRTGNNPGHLDELDLYASVSHSFGAIDTWLGYTAYTYPEAGGGNTNEVGTGFGTALGPIDFAVGGYYDFNIGGWYFDFTGGHSFVFSDRVSLDLAAGISYQVDYNNTGSDFNNVLLVASLPIALTERASLIPYVAATFSMDAIDGLQDDQLFGGVSLSVSF
ncbi:MAG: hypothetical protein ACC661_01550 [Verrucomicrobiales bacterium]